jgi:2,3-bisphosphoglycerate-independent phosphoglycerate mutase
MKRLMLVCEGMADDPMQELSGRTPLEAAKTPHMDALAKKSSLGTACFVPRSLKASGDVACLSILGFDPEEFYTGVAPLEAASMGITQNPSEVAFRCDFVTALDDQLVDASASWISPRESQLLIQELNQKLFSSGVRLHAGQGYKNILIVSDPALAQSLDEVECAPPRTLIGQKFSKSLPAGKNAGVLLDWMNQSKRILENHEINRVRIDLGENPANMIWPWGQGQKLNLPSFEKRFGRRGALMSDSDFARGLGKALGLKVVKAWDWPAALEEDFVFVYKQSNGNFYKTDGWKEKIRMIEEFDGSVVGEAVKNIKLVDGAKIFVGADYGVSLPKRQTFSTHVPFLITSAEGTAKTSGVFNEKTAAESALIFDQGHLLMESFLK